MVFAKGKEKFGKKNGSIWSDKRFQTLIISSLVQYASNHNVNHRLEIVCQLLEIGEDTISADGYYWETDKAIFSINKKVEKLSDEKREKLLFLLTVVSFGENRHEGSDVSQKSVEDLSRMLGLDLPRLDAQARVEMCDTKPSYKKFRPVAEQFLQKVVKSKAKKKPTPPNFWADAD